MTHRIAEEVSAPAGNLESFYLKRGAMKLWYISA
jgi:hypothetical protein